MNEKLKTEREKMHGLEMWNDHRQGNSVLITSETENKLSLAGSQLLKSTENPEISTSKQDGQGKRILQIHASQKKKNTNSKCEAWVWIHGIASSETHLVQNSRLLPCKRSSSALVAVAEDWELQQRAQRPPRAVSQAPSYHLPPPAQVPLTIYSKLPNVASPS